MPPHPARGTAQQGPAINDVTVSKIKTKLKVAAQHARNETKRTLEIILSVTEVFHSLQFN